jgi:hypothetical protein
VRTLCSASSSLSGRLVFINAVLESISVANAHSSGAHFQHFLLLLNIHDLAQRYFTAGSSFVLDLGYYKN